MKTKAIVIAVILCALLSSPVFAVSYLFEGTTDTLWGTSGNWHPANGSPVGDPNALAIISSDCDFDIGTGTIDILHTDFGGGAMERLPLTLAR